MKIVYAGYGAVKTIDLTQKIQQLYYSSGQRVFMASNDWGDPDVGNNKSLFIVWEDDNGNTLSAAATESHIGNVHQITLP